MTFIQHLFEYQFLSRALLTALLVGVVCGIMGCFIILRGLSLMGDAMSHAVLPGVALSFMFNIPLFIGALFTGMLSSILNRLHYGCFKNQKRCCDWDYFYDFFGIRDCIN